jgi:hypothetical protein
MISLRLKEK